MKTISQIAIEIYQMGKQYFEVDIRPFNDGSIILQFSKDYHFIDIIIYQDKQIELDYEIGIGSDYKTIANIKPITYSQLEKYFKIIGM